MPINNRVKKTNWYKNIIPPFGKFPTNEWRKIDKRDNFDVVNLGSSSALYAFNYDGINIKGFNWAMQPQSLEYSLKVLMTYKSLLKKNAVVFIPLCPFSGLNAVKKWPKTCNDKYYSILDKSFIDDYLNVKKRREYPLLASPKESIKRLLKDVPRLEMPNYRNNGKIDFESDANKWISNWKKEFSITNLNEPLSEENIIRRNHDKIMMNKLLKICFENSLRPIFVLPPVHRTLSVLLTKDFRKNYIESFVNEFLNNGDYSNMKFLNYLDDDRFLTDDLYYNSFFLNEKGAKLFTRVLLKEFASVS